jgi:hypothetical protein
VHVLKVDQLGDRWVGVDLVAAAHPDAFEAEIPEESTKVIAADVGEVASGQTT